MNTCLCKQKSRISGSGPTKLNALVYNRTLPAAYHTLLLTWSIPFVRLPLKLPHRDAMLAPSAPAGPPTTSCISRAGEAFGLPGRGGRPLPPGLVGLLLSLLPGRPGPPSDR